MSGTALIGDRFRRPAVAVPERSTDMPTQGVWIAAMDEVQAMTHAGETVGRAVGTGLRTIRRGAVQVGQAGAEAAAKAAVAAEQKLAESGQDAAKELVATTRRARRDVAKAGQQAGEKVSRRAARNLHNLADSLPGATRKRRRWPWLLAIIAVAAAGSAVMAKRAGKPDEPMLVDEPAGEISPNGTAPKPRSEQKEFDRKR
ncbi:MAG TPA: hypothetical protein VH333_23715 [Pseudonocardiaceae bacterium]|jgi:hypothetical protein|nr:hypothetical protein [Pseudonocardiaceae bacterium]